MLKKYLRKGLGELKNRKDVVKAVNSKKIAYLILGLTLLTKYDFIKISIENISSNDNITLIRYSMLVFTSFFKFGIFFF